MKRKNDKIIDKDTDSEEEIDFESLPRRKQPERTATTSKSNHNHNESSDSEPFKGDDSNDEYVLPVMKKPRSESSSKQAKKVMKQIDTISAINLDDDQEDEIDFNSHFEEAKKQTDSIQVGSESTIGERLVDVSNSISLIAHSQKKRTDLQNANSMEPTMDKHTHIDGLPHIDASKPQLDGRCCQTDCSKKFDMINDKLNEILSRISVMEREYMHRSHPNLFKAHSTENMENSGEKETQSFLDSNRLPTENLNDLVDFEKNLGNTAFQAFAIKNLNRATRSKNLSHSMDPVKTLRTILGLVIDRRFLADFTWTGKSKPGTRKLPLKDHSVIVSLLYTIVSQIHSQYTKEMFKKHLVDKVLKVAYDLPQKFKTTNKQEDIVELRCEETENGLSERIESKETTSDENTANATSSVMSATSQINSNELGFGKRDNRESFKHHTNQPNVVYSFNPLRKQEKYPPDMRLRTNSHVLNQNYMNETDNIDLPHSNNRHFSTGLGRGTNGRIYGFQRPTKTQFDSYNKFENRGKYLAEMAYHSKMNRLNEDDTDDDFTYSLYR